MTSLLLLLGLAAGIILFLLIKKIAKARQERALWAEISAGHSREHIMLLQNLVEREPENASARLMLVTLLQEQGRHRDAIDFGVPLVHSPPETSSRPEMAALLVPSYEALNRDGDALSLLDPYYRDPEADPLLIHLYARVATGAGEYEKAIRAYERLEAAERLRSPDDLLAYVDLLRSTGRRKEARRRLESLLELHPSHAGVLNRLGEIAREEGDLGTAARCFHELFHSSQGRRRFQIGLLLAEILENASRERDALDLLAKIGNTNNLSDKEAARILEWRAALLEVLGEREEGAELRKRAARILGKPSDSAPHSEESPAVSPETLPAKIRGLAAPAFLRLFRNLLERWGYSVISERLLDDETATFEVHRTEEGRRRKKIAYAARWEGDIGELAVRELFLQVKESGLDGGIYLSLTRFSPAALEFASRHAMIELFSRDEIGHILIPLMGGLSVSASAENSSSQGEERG
ncbi:MAG: hypothetical protein D6679_05530 [Candidatus Hydrogenedentota bacterium]|nr:MAG: hypothetical protein D6679_05530 [Candidatus Hydrogenedentota bacterium]